jgi:DMSO/TMAO reductase YedYZ molybdopterin-dependent catalytic subunit
VTRKWPVLDLGVRPKVDRQNFRLLLDGACDAPQELSFEDLLALPQVEEESDFHCVTTWSRMDLRFKGVRFFDIAAHAEPHEDARHVMCHGSDGYTTNLSLEEALKPDVLVTYQVDGEPLDYEHGGPVRLITPQLYAWKGSKWLCRIEFMTDNRLGFWEERGYSNTAYPWRNDRYS